MLRYVTFHFVASALVFFALGAYSIYFLVNNAWQIADKMLLIQIMLVNTVGILFVVLILCINLYLRVRKLSFWHENLLEIFPQPLAVTDNKFNWLYLNKQAEKILNLKKNHVRYCRSGLDMEKISQMRKCIPFKSNGAEHFAQVKKIIDTKEQLTGYLLTILDDSSTLGPGTEKEFFNKITFLCNKISNSYSHYNEYINTLASCLNGQAVTVTCISETLLKLAHNKDADISENIDSIQKNYKIFSEYCDKSNAQIRIMSDMIADINDFNDKILKTIEYPSEVD